MNAPKRPVLKLRYHDGNVYKLDAIKQIRHDAEQIKAVDPFNVKAKMFEDLADYLEQEVTASALRDLAREKDAEAIKLRDAGRAAQREADTLRKAARLREKLDRVEAQRKRANAIEGAKATRRAANFTHEGLDTAIGNYIALGHDPRRYLDVLMREHHTALRTVYRRIALQHK